MSAFFADEKAINAFAKEQEASAAPQTGLALKVEALRLQILLKYRKEVAYIVGAEALAVDDP